MGAYILHLLPRNWQQVYFRMCLGERQTEASFRFVWGLSEDLLKFLFLKGTLNKSHFQ